MSNIYNDHVLYDDHILYGGVSDYYKITNTLVLEVRPNNVNAVSIKSNNILVENPTTKYYQRIYTGMPMGLLLSITYPEDQDGEIRT